MDHSLAVRVGQAVEHLDDNRDDSPGRHRPGAVVKGADRQLGCENCVAVDDVGVFDGHYVGVAQLRNQTNFAEQRLAVALAVHPDQRNLQGDPDAFDRISCLPDLGGSTLAEQFCQAVLAQSAAAGQTQGRAARSRCFGCVNRANHLAIFPNW